MRRLRVATWLLGVAIVALSGSASGQQQRDSHWLTGDALRRQLDNRVAISWASEPLRTKLGSLASTLQVAIWLDRRIDPSQEPELSLPDLPLPTCLQALAAHLDAGFCFVGPVAYIGPKATAAKLATVAALRSEDAQRLPTNVSNRLARAQPWQWPALTTPRELLEQLAQQYGVRMEQLDQIPHDLWAAGDWPPLTFTERLTLVLAGFDKSFEFQSEGQALRWTPMPDNPRLGRFYTVRGDPLRWISQLQSAVPLVTLERDGPRIRAIGSAEDHEALRRLLSGGGAGPSTPGPAKTVYTMKGPAPLGVVLKTLQEKAGLIIDIDPQAQEKLYQRVMFDVREASLEELLITVMKDTGLRYRLVGNKLTVGE